MNINKILNRTSIEEKIKAQLNYFENNKSKTNIIRAFYFYGDTGIGKTFFIKNLLKDLNYDVIIYDSSDVRNKNFIDNITNDKRGSNNILSIFNNKIKPIAIILDEIDTMNIGDKAGINSLIKLIRPKKTKKQLLECTSNIPIFCIGNNLLEKKLIGLSKVCHVYKLDKPTPIQLNILCKELFNNKLQNNYLNILKHSNLQTIYLIYNLYLKDQSIIDKSSIYDYINNNINYQNSKQVTKYLLNNKIEFKDHNNIINDTDKTTVALLLHENLIDVINKNILLYKKILNIFCYADFIDRITFQKQIWQLNEISCILKIFYSLYYLNQEVHTKLNTEVRFTKILTKYSTEYNNYIFIQEFCKKLDLDRKDLILLINYIYNNNNAEKMLLSNTEYDISKLDINRIYKYLRCYIE